MPRPTLCVLAALLFASLHSCEAQSFPGVGETPQARYKLVGVPCVATGQYYHCRRRSPLLCLQL
jgi:hypothetical protein